MEASWDFTESLNGKSEVEQKSDLILLILSKVPSVIDTHSFILVCMIDAYRSSLCACQRSTEIQSIFGTEKQTRDVLIHLTPDFLLPPEKHLAPFSSSSQLQLGAFCSLISP